jgi:hypothetical protein
VRIDSFRHANLHMIASIAGWCYRRRSSYAGCALRLGGSVSIDHVAFDHSCGRGWADKRDMIMEHRRFAQHVPAVTAREYRKLGRRLPDVPP